MHYTIFVDIYPPIIRKIPLFGGCFMTINRLYGTITTIECSKMKEKKKKKYELSKMAFFQVDS